MEKRKKNSSGAAILIFGVIMLMTSVPKIDFDNLRTVDIVQLSAICVFMGVGVYAMIKSRRSAQNRP